MYALIQSRENSSAPQPDVVTRPDWFQLKLMKTRVSKMHHLTTRAKGPCQFWKSKCNLTPRVVTTAEKRQGRHMISCRGDMMCWTFRMCRNRYKQERREIMKFGRVEHVRVCNHQWNECLNLMDYTKRGDEVGGRSQRRQWLQAIPRDRKQRMRTQTRKQTE